MKIIVASVPGAGKTTILKLVKKKLPKVRIINEGDLILKIARMEFGIKDRDELRKKLTLEQQRYLQEIAAEKIAQMKSKYLFIDTHISIKTPYGYFPALSEKTIHILKPELIIVLEFPPKDILERRLKDKKRRRDIESLEDIEKHQKVNREFALSIATHVESAVEIISFKRRQKKDFEHAKIAAEKIVKLIKKFNV
jgi:adenylate kinase